MLVALRYGSRNGCARKRPREACVSKKGRTHQQGPYLRSVQIEGVPDNLATRSPIIMAYPYGVYRRFVCDLVAGDDHRLSGLDIPQH